MKNNSFLLLLACMFCISLAAQKNPPAIIKNVEITIEGMACQAGCADAINENLEKIDGVTTSAVSFESGKALIGYIPRKITLDSITATIVGTKVKAYKYAITNIENKN